MMGLFSSGCYLQKGLLQNIQFCGAFQLWFEKIRFKMEFQGVCDGLSFRLTDDQAEVIQRKMPTQFTLNLGLQKREQRVAKKVSRYDATFAEAQTPRIQRTQSQISGTATKERSFDPLEEQLMNRAPKFLTEEMKKCYTMFQKLEMSPFYTQLQPILNNGFKQIDKSFWDGHYTQLQFWGDIQKVFQECYLLYSKDNQTQKNVQQLETYFNEIYRNMDAYDISKRPIQRKIQSSKNQQKYETPMTAKEKRILGQNIRDLSPEHLRGVWEIVSEGGNQASGEELEFDIDTLSPKIARKLEKYVIQKLLSLQKNKKVKYDTPVEIQTPNQHSRQQPIQMVQPQMMQMANSQISQENPNVSFSQHQEVEQLEQQPNETEESSFISESNDSR